MTILIRILVLGVLFFFLYRKAKKFFLGKKSDAIGSEKDSGPEEPIKINPKTGRPEH